MEIDFAELGDLSDTAVLLNGIRDEETFKRLVEHKAAAFLILQGKYYFSAEEASEIFTRFLGRVSREFSYPHAAL